MNKALHDEYEQSLQHPLNVIGGVSCSYEEWLETTVVSDRVLLALLEKQCAEMRALLEAMARRVELDASGSPCYLWCSESESDLSAGEQALLDVYDWWQAHKEM